MEWMKDIKSPRRLPPRIAGDLVYLTISGMRLAAGTNADISHPAISIRMASTTA
jgi:hypothetical protein